MNFGCAVQRGLFILRPCRKPVVGVCQSCQRSVCAEHFVQNQFCSECAAQNQQVHSDSFWDSMGNSQSRGAAYYATRHHYYDQYHYHPVGSDWASSSFHHDHAESYEPGAASADEAWHGVGAQDHASDADSWDGDWDAESASWDES